MGLFDTFKRKSSNSEDGLLLSKDDKYFLNIMAAGMWSGGAPKAKDINDLTCRELQGLVSHCIQVKK